SCAPSTDQECQGSQGDYPLYVGNLGHLDHLARRSRGLRVSQMGGRSRSTRKIGTATGSVTCPIRVPATSSWMSAQPSPPPVGEAMMDASWMPVSVCPSGATVPTSREGPHEEGPESWNAPLVESGALTPV